MKNRKWIALIALCICLMVTLLFFIPKKLVSMPHDQVSKIILLNGSTGKSIEITDMEHIRKIMGNLNNVTIKKSELAIGYVGFNKRITIYDRHEKIQKEFIINLGEVVRQNAFFYETVDTRIDDVYLDRLFE
ncbi:hypothetical protein MKY34_08725 [Sporosarcina sp. FSL K6-1522]|uniref:hypothetical protein n=1 Tax=Sporosarcina sp. FSL K6-1522 TaxID=2921554 RepID=UPI003159EC84